MELRSHEKVCRMREVCEKTWLGWNNCELIGSIPTSITRNKPMESGLTRRAGRCIDAGDHRYISRVTGVVKIFGVFLNRGWRPISPVCDRTAPHRLVTLYHSPTRMGGRCGNPTIQRSNGTGVSTPWGAVPTRENSVFFPSLSNFWYYKYI